MKTLIIVVVIAIIAVLLVGGVLVPKFLRIDVPPYQAPPAELVHLDQGWTQQEWHEFHYTAQGTRLVPYKWFMALEQPCAGPGECGQFADPKYLARFGFLAGETDPQLNPDGLPVGFARQADFVDPITGKSDVVLGLTCAACHTGELYWDKYAVRIEGGPAMIEVSQFQKALGLAVGLTTQFPFSIWRYGRFERKVLGDNPTQAEKTELRNTVDALVASGKAGQKATEEMYKPEFAGGFARTDALARIGNEVFAFDMQDNANLSPASAPVRFPQVWDASWLDWVQYNSSIANPLVRNIGESLGVKAVLKLYGGDAGQFKNSVRVRGLQRLENLLSGGRPFGGLTSPEWPDQFPALDAGKVAAGEALYAELCQKCHGPSSTVLSTDYWSAEPKYWRQNNLGLKLLKVRDIPLKVIGTDPSQAVNFKNRKADTGPLGKGKVSAGAGLELVTMAIANNFFDANGFDANQRNQWSGMRDPADDPVRDPLVYKARPLNGAWAIAPYLHNGSVPNLYLLLSPVAERPKTFYTGSRRFDPVHLGYEYGETEGGFLYDTSRPGNSNTGHQFKGDGKDLGNGVIGRGLSGDERLALIEYIKSIKRYQLEEQ